MHLCLLMLLLAMIECKPIGKLPNDTPDFDFMVSVHNHYPDFVKWYALINSGYI